MVGLFELLIVITKSKSPLTDTVSIGVVLGFYVNMYSIGRISIIIRFLKITNSSFYFFRETGGLKFSLK